MSREGDISLLEVDAITNTTDETLTEKNIISKRIFRRAGSGLQEEIANNNRGKCFLRFSLCLFSTNNFRYKNENGEKKNDLIFHSFLVFLSLSLAWLFLECKTGDVRVTKGYNLPAKYIIHTVGPIYSERYKTAAEQTLYSCYRWVELMSFRRRDADIKDNPYFV